MLNVLILSLCIFELFAQEKVNPEKSRDTQTNNLCVSLNRYIAKITRSLFRKRQKFATQIIRLSSATGTVPLEPVPNRTESLVLVADSVQ